jgi:hypothetical protein
MYTISGGSSLEFWDSSEPEPLSKKKRIARALNLVRAFKLKKGSPCTCVGLGLNLGLSQRKKIVKIYKNVHNTLWHYNLPYLGVLWFKCATKSKLERFEPLIKGSSLLALPENFPKSSSLWDSSQWLDPPLIMWLQTELIASIGVH